MTDSNALQACLTLGATLTALRRFDEALAVYADVPATPAVLSNQGMALACAGREQEAEACYRQALALDPGHAKAAFNLSYLLLRQGRWTEGWQRLDARASLGLLQAHLDLPRWQGEPLSGKSILVGPEAGHGDMIQFCRYCAHLKASGAARVGVLCHPGLVRLFAGLHGVDDVFDLTQAPPRIGWHYWTAPLSLPGLFGATVDQVPAALPYIDVDRAPPLPQARPGELKVGLAWKGNPRFENDAERSLPSLATLAPLAQVEDVRFFSLQKGEGEGATADGMDLVDLAPAIADFADTAALIKNLDLVITVDTAVAHLAGALGKRCWVLLPAYLTDWRWLTEREDTPWYPGVMRLFRQRAGEGWAPLIAEVARALAALR